MIAGVVLRVASWFSGAPPGDPLGPVDQNPDTVREEACKLVSEDTSVCSAPKPPAPTGSNGGNGGSGIDLSFVSLVLWILLFAAVAGLLYLLARWALSKNGGGARRRAAARNPDDDDDIIERDAVAVDRSREPTNWRREAEQHRRAGRYRDALRCRYRALVGDLARQGLIDEIPGRTTGEERAQMRRAAAVASEPFSAAADLFDGAWYGQRVVDGVDDDRFQSLERDVLATAGEGRR